MALGDISFDGNSLQTATILTSEIVHESIGTKYAPVFALAHENASKIPFVDYTNKIIQVKGTIYASNVVNLDSALDTFRSYFIGKDKNLDIGYNNTVRRYIATATAIAIDRPGGLGKADYEIEFTATQPFGQDTSTSNCMTTASSQTAGTGTYSLSFNGSAPYQLPLFTYTLSAVSGGTGATVTIGNANTGQTIAVTRNWVAGDILTVDCLNKTVQVNGADVAFSGAFPEFPPGSGSLAYTDNFTTSRTFTLSGSYYPMYL